MTPRWPGKRRLTLRAILLLVGVLSLDFAAWRVAGPSAVLSIGAVVGLILLVIQVFVFYIPPPWDSICALVLPAMIVLLALAVVLSYPW